MVKVYHMNVISACSSSLPLQLCLSQTLRQYCACCHVRVAYHVAGSLHTPQQLPCCPPSQDDVLGDDSGTMMGGLFGNKQAVLNRPAGYRADAVTIDAAIAQKVGEANSFALP